MSAESDLRDDLVAHAGIQALLTTDTAHRIQADRVLADLPRPFIVFTRRQTAQHTTLEGPSAASLITFEIQCWGETRDSVEALANAVEAALLAATHREPYGIPVEDRSSAYDGDLDLEAVVLVVDWWVVP